jgi:DNA invertase Pin-like site-specific DNA recombinase
MKTFGYIRVSGKGQVDGDGPDRQADAITKFCEAHLPTTEPPQMFFEAGVSGTVEAMDRPKFAELISAIEALTVVEPACIVVERLDRLARDLMISEFLLAECRKRKIPVYATDQNDLRDMASDGGDATRVLLRQILGALAQWEKTALVNKLRKARERKRAETGRCEGQLPFGATQEEASAKAIMATWKSTGQSYGRIAKQANQIALKTRSGKPWNRGSVYQVLTGRGNKQITQKTE